MNWRIIKLIIGREFFTRVRKRSFWVMTVIAAIFTTALMVFSVWIKQQENQSQHIIVIDDNYPLFAHLKNESGIKYEIKSDLSLLQAQTLMHESDYTAVLYLPQNILASHSAKLFVKTLPNAFIQRKVENQIEGIIEIEKLKINNIDPEVYAKINTQFNLTPFKLNKPGEEKSINTDKALVGFIFGAFIFFFIMMYCMPVMRGVIEEKSNRIIEVIVSSVKPFEIMMGKILGIACVGLSQFTLWIVFTIVLFFSIQAVVFQDYYDPEVISQMQMTGEVAQQFQHEELGTINMYDPNNVVNKTNFLVMLSLFLFYFLGGYFLYSAMFAAVGSVIDNEAETQQFTFPLVAPLFLGYLISLYVIKNPDSSLAVWSSIIPFTSPIVMMVRAAVGVGGGEGIPYWQVALSMLLLILGFITTTFLAAKVYRAGILMYGKRPTLKEVWKWVTYKS